MNPRELPVQFEVNLVGGHRSPKLAANVSEPRGGGSPLGQEGCAGWQTSLGGIRVPPRTHVMAGLLVRIHRGPPRTVRKFIK